MMNPLKIGDAVPCFESIDDQGGAFSSKNYEGKKWIVFFYPKASTPGCTMEACSLRDGVASLKKLGYHIVGVSADSVERQKRFKEKYNFPYPLLADTEKTVVNTFGVWGEKKFMGKTYDGIHRMTFIINENGRVTHIIEKVNTKNHAEQILEILGGK